MTQIKMVIGLAKKQIDEHDEQIRADVIEEFLATKIKTLVWLIKRQEEGYGTSNGELFDHIYDIAEQLKEQSNE